MAEAGEKIEVKTLKNTDLKPEDISKAIDDSAKVLSGKAKVEPDKPATKPPKPESKPKPEPKPSDNKDEGSQIIVKKRTSYVSPSTASAAPKPADDLPKESKVQLKPPSEHGKSVVAPTVPTPAKIQASETRSDGYAPAPTSESKPTEEPVAEPKPEALNPAEPAKTTKSASAAKPEAPPAQQALKTFDTTEYHLPIKPTAGNHYMNRFLSWTILILVFVGVGGYVLSELEVIDLSQFGL